MMMFWRAGVAAHFQTYSDKVLTILLIAVAILLILVALLSHNLLLKGLVLAWVVLP